MTQSEITKLLQVNKQIGGSIRATILAPFVALKTILSDASTPTPHVFCLYMRNYMRLLGLWPARANAEQRLYYLCNVLIMLLLGVFVVTITCDLYDAVNDFVVFGEDLVVALGLYLILFKICLFRCRKLDIDAIVAEFDALQAQYSYRKAMQNHRRLFYFGEFSAFMSFLILATLLFAAMSVQPLLSSHQLLPFRAKFPFGLDDAAQHPYCFVGIYVFQCCCLFYMLVAIVVMDSVGGCNFSQTTVNLKVLCIRIRQMDEMDEGLVGGKSMLGVIMWKRLREIVQFHQQLISLINRINDVYYWNYVFQMGASTFMICLTAFEALLAQDQPMVAMKFQMYMFSAFMQLFYWCWMGNMTYFDSVDVATAAMEIHAWYEQSPRFQRNLMFLIRRAQKPLEFRARPFFAFNFESFTSILSTSYSYFALLRTMTD